MSELNEFYPYEDMPSIAKGPEKFAADFKGGGECAADHLSSYSLSLSFLDLSQSVGNGVMADLSESVWSETNLKKRKEYIEVQLECLESSVRTIRRGAQERLLYLLQGLMV